MRRTASRFGIYLGRGPRHVGPLARSHIRTRWAIHRDLLHRPSVPFACFVTARCHALCREPGSIWARATAAEAQAEHAAGRPKECRLVLEQMLIGRPAATEGYATQKCCHPGHPAPPRPRHQLVRCATARPLRPCATQRTHGRRSPHTMRGCPRARLGPSRPHPRTHADPTLSRMRRCPPAPLLCALLRRQAMPCDEGCVKRKTI